MIFNGFRGDFYENKFFFYAFIRLAMMLLDIFTC